jgi:hypothetical protein
VRRASGENGIQAEGDRSCSICDGNTVGEPQLVFGINVDVAVSLLDDFRERRSDFHERRGESLSPSWLGIPEDITAKTWGSAINSVFTGALYVPASIREASQDLYGNLKVPLLQDLSTRLHADERGWYPINFGEPVEYSSLIGLSTLGIPTSGKTFISIETSYLYPDCTLQNLTQEEWYEYRQQQHYCNNGRQGDVAMNVDIDGSYNMTMYETYRPIRSPTNLPTVTEPRRISFVATGTSPTAGRFTGATCSLTTTYLEMNVICDGSVCAPTGMRKSQLPHITEAATWFDGLAVPISYSMIEEYWTDAFCSAFINSTQSTQQDVLLASSALSRYLNNPDDAISPLSVPNKHDELTRSDFNETAFSYHFAQLLNTYYLATTSLVSVIGGFTSLKASGSHFNNGEGLGVNTTAQLQTKETLLAYNAAWVIVLLVGSLVMLIAGIATMALNLVRRGPEILDSLTGMLRDNPYVHVDIGPSTEDASSQVRGLRKTSVMLGDVMPKEMTGHVALGTQHDGESVQRLRADRLYW